MSKYEVKRPEGKDMRLKTPCGLLIHLQYSGHTSLFVQNICFTLVILRLEKKKKNPKNIKEQTRCWKKIPTTSHLSDQYQKPLAGSSWDQWHNHGAESPPSTCLSLRRPIGPLVSVHCSQCVSGSPIEQVCSLPLRSVHAPQWNSKSWMQPCC